MCIGIDVYVHLWLYSVYLFIYFVLLSQYQSINHHNLFIVYSSVQSHLKNKKHWFRTRETCVSACASKSLILLLVLALKISRLIVKSACLPYTLQQQQWQQYTLNTIWAHRRNDRFARFWFFKLLESSNSSNGNNNNSSNNNENTSHTKHEP